MIDLSIFQAGVPRSGNLWIYRTIQKVFDVTDTPTQSLALKFKNKLCETSYLERDKTYSHDVLSIRSEGVFWEPTHQSHIRVHNFDNYVSSCSHIWTHQPFCDERSELYQKFGKIVYILRDPRDVLISNSKYLFTDRTTSFRPREDASENSRKFIEDGHFKRVHGWIRHVGSYLKHLNTLDNMYFVFYERFLADFDTELANLSSFLGISLTPDQANVVKTAVSFDTMHQEKPEHVRKGTTGQWESSLTPEQIQNIKIVGGPFLEFLGYGAEKQLDSLPGLPPITEINPATIEVMITASGKQRSRLLRERKNNNED